MRRTIYKKIYNVLSYVLLLCLLGMILFTIIYLNPDLPDRGTVKIIEKNISDDDIQYTAITPKNVSCTFSTTNVYTVGTTLKIYQKWNNGELQCIYYIPPVKAYMYVAIVCGFLIPVIITYLLYLCCVMDLKYTAYIEDEMFWDPYILYNQEHPIYKEIAKQGKLNYYCKLYTNTFEKIHKQGNTLDKNQAKFLREHLKNTYEYLDNNITEKTILVTGMKNTVLDINKKYPNI